MKAHGEFLKVKKEKEDLEAQMALLQGRLKEVSKVFEKKSSERKTAKAQYDKVLSKLETFVWLLQDSDEKDDEAEDEEEEEDSNDGSGEEL